MGLLSALGALSPNEDGTQNGLQRFGAALDPQSGYYQQEAIAKQQQNQVTQNALAALADARARGITNPQSLLSTLATVDPQYAEKAATLQSQNPLAALLQQNAGGTGTNTGTPISGLAGDGLLKALPAGIAAQVQGYAEGRLQPSPMMMRTKEGQQLMQLVSQYDPSFDAVNYAARAATRKDFTAGKAAQNITALNTAVGHISTLQDAANALDNTDYPTINSIVNTVKNLTGSDKVKNFDTAKDAVADELTRVFRGSGGSVSDIESWKKKLDAANSPEQFKGVLNQMTELLNSRLDALGQQYNQGMGTTKQGIELLSPKAQAAYQKITGSPAAETGVTGNLAADNAAQPQQPSKIAEGTTATNPQTGAKIVFKGGKWQPVK